MPNSLWTPDQTNCVLGIRRGLSTGQRNVSTFRSIFVPLVFVSCFSMLFLGQNLN